MTDQDNNAAQSASNEGQDQATAAPKSKKLNGTKAKAKAKTSALPDAESPNIVFVGKRNLHGKNVEDEAPRELRDGLSKFRLPTDEEQKAGFYHKDANQIIRAFPHMYKQFVKKGDTRNG